MLWQPIFWLGWLAQQRVPSNLIVMSKAPRHGESLILWRNLNVAAICECYECTCGRLVHLLAWLTSSTTTYCMSAHVLPRTPPLARDWLEVADVHTHRSSSDWLLSLRILSPRPRSPTQKCLIIFTWTNRVMSVTAYADTDTASTNKPVLCRNFRSRIKKKRKIQF